jgi:hypothetical protein
MKTTNALCSALKEFTRFPAMVIPKAYRDEPSALNAIYKWFLVGLLARVIFMPIAFHGDLLSTYHRSHLLAFDGQLQYLNPHEIIQAAFLFIFSHITPLQEYLTWTGTHSVPVSFWLGVLENTNIFRTIFLLKVPYLLFDLLICIVILHIFSTDTKGGLRAFMLWFLNPIVIFAVYIFGRFEVIPIFFILLCIYFLKENKIPFAALSLGIAIVDRYYILFILPLLLLLYCQTWIDKAKVAAVSATPLIMYNAITKLSADTLTSLNMAGSQFVDYFLYMRLNVGPNSIYIFIVAYTCILLYAYYTKKSEKPVVDFTSYSLIILLLFYTTSYFHPQYFAWFIPFFALYYGFIHDKTLIELHCFQVVCFIVFTFSWGQALATWMFASINPEILISLPSPMQFINQLYPGLTIVNMARSVLSAVSLFMIAKIILNQMRGHKSEERS